MHKPCERCGKSFYASPSSLKAGYARFCSYPCRKGLNEIRVEGEDAYVYLTGKFDELKAVAKIDAADVPKICEFGKRWSASWNDKYQEYRATTRIRDGKNKSHVLYLHRWIVDAPDGLEVDHVNHDVLDARRSNLRLVGRSQNMQNRRKANANTRTGVRNVSLTPQGTYLVQVKVNYVNHRIGTFKKLSEAEAAAVDARRKLMTHSMD